MPNSARLPKPLFESYEWQERGACRNADPDRFFVEDGCLPSHRMAREREAKALCAACPVLRECLRHALTVREPFGVWGGLSSAERDRLIHDRADVGLSSPS